MTGLFAALSAAGGSAQSPDVAVDGEGDATAVWSRWDGSRFVVQSATRPAGGTWSAPTDLAAAARVDQPQLALDAAGNATAVWRSNEAGESVVQASTRPAGGSWGAPVDLSTEPAQDPSEATEVPRVAVDASGTATVVWARAVATGRYVVQAATLEPGGAPSAPLDLSAPGESARTPEIVVDPAGGAVAVWNRGASRSSGGVVQAAVRPAGGTWQASTDLSASGGMSFLPQVAMDASGRATAVWLRLDGSYVVESATRAAGGTWGTAERISAAGEDTSNPQVAAGPRGAVAVWQRHDGSGWRVTSATRAANGTWQRSGDLSAADHDAWSPQVALAQNGRATVVWDLAEAGSSHRESQSQAVTRGVTGEWSEPVDLDGEGTESRSPQVALDAAGNATTTWSTKVGSDWIVQARGLDAAGPVVTRITSRSAGDRQRYSVSAHDVWSRIRTATWRFSDGTRATGSSVSHGRAAGSGEATVVLTDAVGNATRCTYTGGDHACRAARGVPIIRRATLKHHRIRAVGSRRDLRRRTALKVDVTAAAKVTLVFSRPGTRKKVRLVRRVGAGTSAIRVQARVGRRATLRPGRWTVTVKAGNRIGTGPRTRVHLRVVR